MIVQITPVAPGRSRVTTASKKDGGGGSQQAPRPGAVCSCNVDVENLQKVLLSQQKTGNRLASLGTSASATNVASVAAASNSQISKLQHASTSGTSLDLTSSTHQPAKTTTTTAAPDSLAKQSRELTNEELIKFLQELNGDLKWIDQAQLKQLTKDYEFLKAVVDRIIQQRKQQSKPSLVAQQQQQQPTTTTVLAQQKPKSYHMSNGDVVSSLKQQQQQSHDKAHTLSRSKSALAAKQVHVKSSEAEQATIQSLLRSEFFDRTLDQRHSSRSAEGGRSKDDEWTQAAKLYRQRHLSGPSDLSLLKDDISEWLLSLSLARKREKQLQQQQSQQPQAPPPALPPKPGQSKPPSGGGEGGATGGATLKLRLQFKDELKEILKKPIQRQHSGPPDLTAIKNDLIQWLTKQQLADKNDRGREDLDLIRPAPSADRSGGAAKQSKSVPKLVKRHSLGPGEEVFFKASDSTAHPTTCNIQYQRIHRDKPNLIQLPSSCVDIHRNSDRTDHTVLSLSSSSAHHHRTQDRKLRHSASEVVTPTSERAPIQATSGHLKTFHYEYQSKTAPKHSTKQDSALKLHIHTHALPGSDAATKEHRSRKDRTKRHPTQRSATVSEMEIQNKHKKRSHSRSRTPQPWEPCTDPSCPYLPVCTDPNCYMNLYDTPRCASLPRTKEKLCASTCYECNSLCTASRCMQTKSKVKSNSLPRCVSTHRSSSHPTSLLRQTTTDTTDGKSSLPRLKTAISKSHAKQNGTSSNGKLIKSISAASLNSRRRRHKTVHFGENLLREVCQNRKLIKPLQDSNQQQPSGTQLCQPNIQMLYNFVEGVLSAWVDEDDEHKSGPESEPERGALVKPLHRCNRIRFLTIKRIVNEAAELRGALKLGNSRFRHRHWRGTAKECNERFLRKVFIERIKLRSI